MNLQQMTERVKTLLGIPPAGDAHLTDVRIKQFINDALARFSTERDWPHLLTSITVSFDTDGTADAPAGMIRARQVVIGGFKVRFAPLSEFLNPVNRTNRYVWTQTGATLRIDPSPSASTDATLWYYRAEPTLDTDDDEPLLPATEHPMIVAFAAHLGALSRSEPQRAQARSMAPNPSRCSRRRAGNPRCGHSAQGTPLRR